MIRKNIFILTLILVGISAFAQNKPDQFKPFIGNQEVIGSSGPGLTQSSGDILLQLKEPDDPDMVTLMLLRRTNGKLKRIAENSGLLMGSGMLGASGGGYAGINDDGELYVDYRLGSNSAVSDILMVFEKSNDGSYYFKEHTMETSNYGVENLFARQRITAAQTGKMDFSTTSENDIFQKAKINTSPVDSDEPLYKAAQRYAKYISEGWRLAAFAEGDLNLDGFKKDLLLVLYNEGICSVRPLLQQEDGTYKTAQENDVLIVPDETFNISNLKAVVKNGYFTVERRVATDDNDFDHRYLTFKYHAAQKNWYLHRYDVEHFSGFNPKPSTKVTHLTQQHFGKIPFEELDYTPGDYFYEPALATVSGTLVKKQFYGMPNYGETPETDEKVMVFILKPDYPVNVFAGTDQTDPETADQTIRDIQEIQVYTTDKSINLGSHEGEAVKLTGVLQMGHNGHHHTPVLMNVMKWN